MIKLIHVMPSLAIGGAEALLVDIIKMMDRSNFEISVCSLYKPQQNRLEKELADLGIPIYYLDKHQGFDGRMILRFNRIVAEIRPDIIHTHNYVMRYTIPATLLRQVPIRIHTVHNIASREVDRVGRLIHWCAFNLFRVVPVSISQCVASSVQDVYGKSSPVVYNGIFTVKFTAVRRNRKKNEDIVFVHIGNFRPQKNHFLLIEAFAIASRIMKNIRLVLVGDGPLRKDVEKKVKENGLDVVVDFLGTRSDVPEILSQSDILLSTSKWEGFGLSIVEAMASGLPVIATAVDGVPELIKHNQSGILVKSNDAEALANAMIRLAGDSKMIEEYGKAGRQIAVASYDINSTARNYERLYWDLIKVKPGKRYGF